MLALNSIQVVQVGNAWDPYLISNAYTLNYSSINLASYPNYGYMTVLLNTYEGCLISLMWNKIYTSPATIQIDRTTYTIRKHIAMSGASVTEFHSTGKYVFNYTAPLNYNTIKSLYTPACQSNKLYWHPYRKLNFFLDYFDNWWRVIFVCIPYNTPPQKACDADFNNAVAPTFVTSSHSYYNGDYFTLRSVLQNIVFTKNNAYMAVLYIDQGCNCCWCWVIDRWNIAKVAFSETTCAASSVTMLKDSPIHRGDASGYVINNLAVIP